MCTRYPIINRVSELKVHIELTRFVQPEKIEIDANERAVNEKSQYCFFVCTTFDSFLNDLSSLNSRIDTVYHNFCAYAITFTASSDMNSSSTTPNLRIEVSQYSCKAVLEVIENEIIPVSISFS